MRPNYKKDRDTIAQYDGNDDPDSDTDVDDTPLESIHLWMAQNGNDQIPKGHKILVGPE